MVLLNMPVTLSVDASQTNLGATLLPENLRVAYESKALTETERIYAQIGKESLAIALVYEEFHYHIRGKKVLSKGHHNSLESIFKKSMSLN